MKRKLSVAINQWLPNILACVNDCEVIDTLSLHRYCGRILVVLGNAQAQFDEIQSVIEELVAKRVLVIESRGKVVQWHGLSIENIKYAPTSELKEFVAQALANPVRKGDQTERRIIENKTYCFNLTFSVEKLIEANLNIDSLTPFLRAVGL